MLSTRDANEILRGVHFPGEEKLAQNAKIAAAEREVRKKLILLPIRTEEGRIAAAVEIQRVWRGFFTRLRLASILEGAPVGGEQPQQQQRHPRVGLSDGKEPDLWTPAARSPLSQPGSGPLPIQAAQPTQQQRLPIKLPTATATKSPERRTLHQRYGNYRQEASQHDPSEVISYEDYCAHYIQSWWFKMRGRRRETIMEQGASPTPRAVLPGYPPRESVSLILTSAAVPMVQTMRKKRREEPIGADEAAIMIQRAWRRHIDIQVFRYYRDLINFRCCGNPALMLRCVNPREASLLDPAAGIHIKFRLAGVKFPPNIYYKIFTHRNVVDMCANSPKDYTAAAVKRRDAKDVHNRRKGSSNGRDSDRMGWYKRIENNGWRLVSDRVILQSDQDPVTYESSRRPQEFHHSKLKRKADIEKRKRRRKLEWMQKMYKEGIMEARGQPTGGDAMIGGAAAGMLAVMDERGPDAVDDWEVDELLQWTDGLNFDDYLADWQAIATSASSEKIRGDSLKFDTTQLDPFEFSLSVDTPAMSNTSPDPSTGKRAPMPTPLKSDVIVS